MFHILMAIAASLSAHAAVVVSDVKVVHVSGSAMVQHVQLKTGSVLNNGDDIVVGSAKDAYVDLKFTDGHRARLKSDTTFRIGSSNKGTSLLNLLRGRVFIDHVKSKSQLSSHPTDDKTGRFEIRTKTAVAGVRGTQFLIEYDEVKGTYICVCEGEVSVTSTTGGEVFPVSSGQDLWSKPNVGIHAATEAKSMSQMTQQEFDSMNF